MRYRPILLFLLILLCFTTALGQEPTDETEGPPDTVVVDSSLLPAPVTNLQARDTEDDNGHSVTLTWDVSTDDGSGRDDVYMYMIYRSMSPEGPFDSVGVAMKGATEHVNSSSKDRAQPDFMPDHTDYYYQVGAVTVGGLITRSDVAGPVQSYGQFFNMGRIPVFVFVVVFCALVVFFVASARKGADLYVRPLAGIEAVDDAIGRATEMGRPILYVLGLGTAEMVATIASFTILGRVAKRVAEYQTKLIVPCYESIVMAVAQEVVKSAYADAGRPDDYDEDSVFFVTSLQFAYVAAVNGIMLRELPATNVYMGKFFAESLLLAETGSIAGSIQIAGTDEIAQIPFFIVACDYTLIGEELYAASAYLGREPILLGSLKAQDLAKAAVVIIALAGLIATTFGWPGFAEALHVEN
ncbi:MAG: fibronectin type III domain-containing protein [Candidatus Zixiibacteriota bacterium]|nr:MAG: fibronectin type III domain-containing protein [candidate division Zixibacteria bacterium]